MLEVRSVDIVVEPTSHSVLPIWRGLRDLSVSNIKPVGPNPRTIGQMMVTETFGLFDIYSKQPFEVKMYV